MGPHPGIPFFASANYDYQAIWKRPGWPSRPRLIRQQCNPARNTATLHTRSPKRNVHSCVRTPFGLPTSGFVHAREIPWQFRNPACWEVSSQPFDTETDRSSGSLFVETRGRNDTHCFRCYGDCVPQFCGLNRSKCAPSPWTCSFQFYFAPHSLFFSLILFRFTIGDPSCEILFLRDGVQIGRQ